MKNYHIRYNGIPWCKVPPKIVNPVIRCFSTDLPCSHEEKSDAEWVASLITEVHSEANIKIVKELCVPIENVASNIWRNKEE